MMKKCSKCGIEKELTVENFALKNTGMHGFDSMCKDCKKEYDKKRYAKNKEKNRVISKAYYQEHLAKRKAYQRKYYAENKEKCKSANAKWQKEKVEHRRIINARSRAKDFGRKSTLTLQQWAEIKEQFNDCCAYCGLTEKESLDKYGERLHHEHVVPLINGGLDIVGNVVPSCRSCNSKKANSDFSSWYPVSDVYDSLREKQILEYLP